MVNAVIATDGNSIWLGDSKYMEQMPYTMYCVEQMSNEMFEALLTFANMEETALWVSNVLYHILSTKWLSTN